MLKSDSLYEASMPRSDLILMVLLLFKCMPTLIRLVTDARIAGLLYTTKCSPNKIIFAGAEVSA